MYTNLVIQILLLPIPQWRAHQREGKPTNPMNTFREASIRCSGDDPEIIISPDPPVGELGWSCERDRRTTGYPCSCLNAQMIGEIVAASRRLASLPPVGRFVAPTIARCKTEQWTLTPVEDAIVTCYVHRAQGFSGSHPSKGGCLQRSEVEDSLLFPWRWIVFVCLFF